VSEPPPSPATAPGWRVWLARADLPGRLLALLLLAAVSAAGGFLLVPPGPDRLPGAEALGTRSTSAVRADRDYQIVDEEATARRRAEAAAGVRPVYDADDAADEEAAARIHAAFALMRAEEAALREQRPVVEPAELARRYGSQRDAFVARLQLLVRDEDFVALSAARFSEPAERELAALAAKGLTGLVVGDRALLPADRRGPLDVRTFHGVQSGERMVTDRSLVRSVATAREEVASAAAARLAAQPAPLRATLQHLAAQAIRPTLVQNQGETERRQAEAEARVRPVVVPVKRGEPIVDEGERIEARHLVVFDAMRAARTGQDRALVRLGGAALVALLVAALWRFARLALPGFRPRPKDAVLLAALLAGGLGLAARGPAALELLAEQLPGLPRGALAWALPLAAGTVLVRQVLSAQAALALAIATGLGAGLVAGPSVPVALQVAVTSLAAAAAGRGQRDRPGLGYAGLAAGLSGAALAAAVGLHAALPALEVLAASLAAFLGGTLVLPALVALLQPVLTGLFGYVTEARLQELANLNHPALKELIVQAPGTYHHAIVMGSLVEAAAKAIGADPLLARVGASYHDLGKIKNPLSFAENQRGENEHDGMAPTLSALVVKRHVADGLELARRWRLPRPVVDILAQHHGTRRIAYFWAKQQKLEEAGGPAADEASFRYAGPRPGTREAALVMIADVCEASVRALAAPSAAALRATVEARLAELVAERQLDECDLTLRDLAAVTEAMAGALEAISHPRPGSADRPSGRKPPEGRPPVQLVASP